MSLWHCLKFNDTHLQRLLALWDSQSVCSGRGQKYFPQKAFHLECSPYWYCSVWLTSCPPFFISNGLNISNHCTDTDPPQICSWVGELWSLLLEPPSLPGTMLILMSLINHSFGKICHHRRTGLRVERGWKERKKPSCSSASSTCDTRRGWWEGTVQFEWSTGIKGICDLFYLRWTFRGFQSWLCAFSRHV